MTDMRCMTEEEITRVLADMGQPAFRGKQVFTWLHRGVRSFDEMSNLSNPCASSWPRHTPSPCQPWPESRNPGWTAP